MSSMIAIATPAPSWRNDASDDVENARNTVASVSPASVIERPLRTSPMTTPSALELPDRTASAMRLSRNTS